jgi:hypothetical protein
MACAGGCDRRHMETDSAISVSPVAAADPRDPSARQSGYGRGSETGSRHFSRARASVKCRHCVDHRARSEARETTFGGRAVADLSLAREYEKMALPGSPARCAFGGGPGSLGLCEGRPRSDSLAVPCLCVRSTVPVLGLERVGRHSWQKVLKSIAGLERREAQRLPPTEPRCVPSCSRTSNDRACSGSITRRRCPKR